MTNNSTPIGFRKTGSYDIYMYPDVPSREVRQQLLDDGYSFRDGRWIKHTDVKTVAIYQTVANSAAA